jgi:aminoglycoside 3-N-acetyltransferase
MSEADVIKNTKSGPITQNILKENLLKLGLKPGMVLIAHTSLSKIGWTVGGPVALIYALEEILGLEGTLVMPTHTGDLSDPVDWSNPPVPEDWKEIIRQNMPVFDPDLTPTRGIGRTAETFRKQKGVVRSVHPQVSFAAWGKYAQEITRDHGLDFALGDRSPLARIYELEGWILLLGVGHDSNTSLHLAEFRADYKAKKEIKQGAPLLVNGERAWVKLREYDEQSEKFPEIAKAYIKSGGLILQGKIGNAETQLIPQKPLVDFAVKYIESNW